MSAIGDGRMVGIAVAAVAALHMLLEIGSTGWRRHSGRHGDDDDGLESRPAV